MVARRTHTEMRTLRSELAFYLLTASGAAVQVIKALDSLVQADKSNESAKEIVDLMYHTALLTSGFDVESPKQYASQVYGMMGMALSSASSSNSGASASRKADKAAKSKPSEAIDADEVIEEK
jgi:Hsp90 protein